MIVPAGGNPNNKYQASINDQERFDSEMEKATDNNGHQQHGDFQALENLCDDRGDTCFCC